MASATTFDFLGFTHVWGRSMQGKDVVRQITAKGRFARALKSVHDWCKRHRHLPIAAQRDHLAKVIRGHCAYYGLTGNGKSYVRKLVTELSGGVFGYLDSVLERHSFDEFGELI